MDMASNQPDNLALTAEQLREYSAAFNADRANLVAANAAVSNGILQAATSYRGVRELPRTFSVELKQGSITSQEHSGRCWMFASLNTLRYELMHKWNLDDFEFSESYLFFYDKLEKSNFYLENVLKTLDKTTDSRIFEAVNEGRLTMAAGGRCSSRWSRSTVWYRRRPTRSRRTPAIPRRSSST